MSIFQTKSDLPLKTQEEIDRILAIASAQRNSYETNFLASRSDYIYNEVLKRNEDDEIVSASGHTVPTGMSGFAKSAIFRKSNAVAGTKAIYENTGDSTTAVWNLMGEVSADDFSAVTQKYYVDGSRTDEYTADGTIMKPYKTIKSAQDAINTISATLLTTNALFETSKFVVHIAKGTYSDNITISTPRYLRYEMEGVIISGSISITQEQLGISDYYGKVEFVGSRSNRAEKGKCAKISGDITFNKSAYDSLAYDAFIGVEITGDIKYGATAGDGHGTWVLYLENTSFSDTSKSITTNFTTGGHCLLIETFGFNEIKSTLTGVIDLYDCNNTSFRNINITPANGCEIKNSKFTGSVSIVASKTLSIDANSYKSLLSRTPTLTGMTLVHLDYVNPTVGKEYFVDGSRTDSYTATGSIFAPFKTIATALTAINADSAIQQAIDPATYALQARYILNVTPGIYSDNLTIGNVKYLRINLNGAEISGNITYTTTMVGGTADQYYSKLEFFGGHGIRAEKGNSGRITGTITATRNNDSLSYVSFSGIDLAGNVKFTTQGTWVVHMHNTRVGAFFEGSTLNGGLVLLETTGWVEFTSAGHIANSADGSATTVSLYRVQNTEFDLINITPLTESLFFNCKFKSDVTVTAQTLYLDNNSYKSLIAQTENLTGATVSLLDDFKLSATAQEEIAGNVGGAISVATFLSFISSDAGGDAFTLASGTHLRQQKKIIFRTDGGGDAVVTGAFAGTANTLTFNDAGEYVLLEWNGTDWIALEIGSVLDLTNAPVLTTV